MTGKKGISLLIPIIALAFLLGAFHVSSAQEKGAIDKLIKEFQPSSLTQEAQRKELEWFQKAAKPYVGMKIKSVAEDIQTHRYESEVIAKAFKEITGIEVSHDIIGEGDVVQRLQTQIA